MRYLALDIGEVRIGIAASDISGKISHPLEVLPAREVIDCSKSFRRVLEDYEPEVLVVGLPHSLSGEEGAQAQRVRKVAVELAEKLELPLEFVDERLSSREAKLILREQGLNEKSMRGRVDMVAASLFLQTFLDEQDRG